MESQSISLPLILFIILYKYNKHELGVSLGHVASMALKRMNGTDSL